MADVQTLPQRVSPLLPHDDLLLDLEHLRLAERKTLTAIQILAFKDKHRDAAAAIGSTLGIDCTTEPGHAHVDGPIQVCWNGPSGWMVIGSDDETGGELLAQLTGGLGDLAAVVDQSHGRCGLRLSGVCARDVMAKICAIDLHPRAFGPGRCAMTSVAHMNATLVQVDDAPTYDLYVARSLAQSFAKAIEHACQEFRG